MANVFLSHSSKDARLADTIHRSLADLHHETFLDHDPGDGIAPGAAWEASLYERLQWADALVCLVTRSYLASLWCSIEVAIAKAQGRRIVPLAAESGLIHPLLTATQHLDYGKDATGALARLAGFLSAIDAGGGIAWNPERAVFPGLLAFDTDDRAMFFGRDREIREAAKEIRARVGQRQPRALIVVGASGSGKSSLVRAGVIPHLLDDPAWWRLLPIMPGEAPFVALGDAVARGRKEVGLPPNLESIDVQRPGGLATAARAILLSAPGDRRHLLVTIDQLEELFTRGNDTSRSMFLAALTSAASEPDGPIAVVATMRSEFLGELLRSPEGRLLHDRPFLLAPLDREQLEDVIAKPAQRAQIAFEPHLIRRLVADTGSGDALPLLAFTLARLVDGLRPGDRVDLARYEASGGVRRSVEIQAETALSTAHTASGCTDAEVLATLMAFVTLDEAGRPARRRRRRADLPPAADAIVTAFEQARLLTTQTDEGVEFVSVAHETLFTVWDRMARAIHDATATLKVRRDLERAAAEWVLAGRPPAFLWRGQRSVSAQQLLGRESDLGADERAFLLESAAGALEEARREAQILADRVETNGLLESDPELALLYLLAAVDEYAVTPSVIAGMRRALSAQRLVGGLGPLERKILSAMVSDDGEWIAVVDLGTNRLVRPSTRPQPQPPVGEVQLTVYNISDGQARSTAALHGRVVHRIAWSRDSRLLAVAIDTRVYVLAAETLATLSTIDASGTETPPRDRGRRHLEISPDNRRIEIHVWQDREAFVLGGSGPDWVRVDSPAPSEELPTGTRGVPHPTRFTHLVECRHAGRLLDISGNSVLVWAAEPVDSPQRASAADLERVFWIRGATAGNDLLALSPDGRLKCVNSPLRLVDVRSNTEHKLRSDFAVAAAFSGDGRRLAVAGRTDIGFFDTVTHQPIFSICADVDEEGDTYSSVALNRDGSVMASGSVGGGLSGVYEVASKRYGRNINGRWVGISSDGSLVASSTAAELVVHFEDGTVAEVPTKSESISILGAHSAAYFGFDETNTALLAVGATVAEYSLPDGSLAAQYPAELEAIGFSADGRHVLGRTAAGILRWPDRSSDAVIARARKAVYRPLTDVERADYNLRTAGRP
jgi:WD40 repeat protein